jgi:F-type H+-transporting ATPase subunit gamma
MANLKEVRTRIESVKSTQQITSAMKMVSASKLRKAQTTIQNLRPYSEKLQTIVQRVFSQSEEPIVLPYNEHRPPERILLIAIASNRGLCGPFNINLGKAVMTRIAEEYAGQYRKDNVEIFTIGKKLFEFLKARNIKVNRRNDELIDNLSPEIVGPLVSELMKLFEEKKYDRIEIIHHRFKNAAVHLLNNVQFLPFQRLPEIQTSQSGNSFKYLLEPSREQVLDVLIPKWLNLQLFETLADSAASEHGARMIAMHKATDNAGDLLKNLKVTYNKARQSAITNEIIEIISGAEAFKSE